MKNIEPNTYRENADGTVTHFRFGVERSTFRTRDAAERWAAKTWPEPK